MNIICRLSTLFKVALVAWTIGALIGFWAGQQVAATPDQPLVVTSEPLSGTAGTCWGKGGEIQWRPIPSWW